MNEIKKAPLVSIGMPVRNEEKYIRESLTALIKQENINFEIIISDNASTDATEAICREFAELYPQIIQYHRVDENIGVSANFASVLKCATGKYFMWASGHDLWRPTYLYACSNALEQNDSAIIAFGTTNWIDSSGAPYNHNTGWSDTRGLSRVGRYCTIFWGNMNPIIGLIRREHLRQKKFNGMLGIDLAILLALSLQGDFVHCTETAWSRREFRQENNYSEKVKRYKSTDYALNTSFIGKYFPLIQLPFRIIKDVWKAEIKLSEKLVITMILLTSLPSKYLVDKLKKNES